MQNVISKNTGNFALGRVVSGICVFAAVLYFIGFYLWAMDIFSGTMDGLGLLYTKVNPFTLGAYFLGFSVLLFCAFYKSRVLKAVLCIFYILAALFSLVAVMGMDSAAGLLIYVPHLLIIAGIVYIFWRAWGKSRGNIR